ncbi:MAG: hypothetical protein ACJ739_12125 [Acidimicrobiales bacterium]
MNIGLGFVVIAIVTSIAVAVMLAVRRRAPEGGFVADGDRAAGVFGVIATGFSVLLGFLIFLAFESYDASRTGAETEALTVAQQVETAQRLPSSVSADLTGELVCYARWVVDVEWEQMEDGTLNDRLNPWGPAMYRTMEGVDLETPVEQSSFDQWLEQTAARQLGRQDRIHGAAGVMPTPLWIALFFISLIVLGFILTFADSGERAVVQALYMGGTLATILAMLLVLRFLDDPVQSGVGGLKPTAMARSLVLMDETLDVVGVEVDVPCDAHGRPQ